MYKMRVIDIFAAFYICEKIVLANIAKIKRSRIKDGLQYHVLHQRTLSMSILAFDAALSVWITTETVKGILLFSNIFCQ